MLQSRIFVEQFFLINMCWTRPLHWDSSIFIFPEHEDRLGENTQMWENSQIAQQTYCLSNVIFELLRVFDLKEYQTKKSIDPFYCLCKLSNYKLKIDGIHEHILLKFDSSKNFELLKTAQYPIFYKNIFKKSFIRFIPLNFA